MTWNDAGIREFLAGLPVALDEGTQDTANDVKSLAADLAPVDEGDLKSTVRVLPKQQEGERTVAAGGISGPNKFVDYTEWVEYGGGDNNPAQPFMTPAAMEIDPAFRFKKTLKALEKQSKI